VFITGKRGNAVLLAEDDWNAINETLHLLSVPGMRELILEGMQEKIGDCAAELEWYYGHFTTPSRSKRMRES
jgi:antitoxin YefM